MVKKINVAVHVVLIFLMYLSPFWLDWRLVLLLLALNYVQLAIFGGCILTIQQFKSTEMSFQEWLWLHLGFKINRHKFNKFLRWQLPFILLIAALIWQELLGFSALLRI